MTDIELWNAFTDGDKEAFSTLFRRYYSLLFQYGSKIITNSQVVEDTIQELFIELWQKRSSPDLVSVKAYLLQALKFKLYKTFRAKRLRVIDEEEGAHVFELSQETVHINKEEDEVQTEKLYKALQQLSPRQREVIYLKVYKGLSYEEVSEIMGLNYQVVRNLLYTSLKSFKKLYAFLLMGAILLFFLFCLWHPAIHPYIRHGLTPKT